MALTEEERRTFEAQVQRELERDHDRRLENLERLQARQRERLDAHTQREQEIEKASIRAELQRRFYEERGYKLYTDSSGREIWLSAEEFAFRTRRRRRRVKRRPSKVFGLRWRTVLLYTGAMIIAVIVGLAMTR